MYSWCTFTNACLQILLVVRDHHTYYHYSTFGFGLLVTIEYLKRSSGFNSTPPSTFEIMLKNPCWSSDLTFSPEQFFMNDYSTWYYDHAHAHVDIDVYNKSNLISFKYVNSFVWKNRGRRDAIDGFTEWRILDWLPLFVSDLKRTKTNARSSIHTSRFSNVLVSILSWYGQTHHSTVHLLVSL